MNNKNFQVLKRLKIFLKLLSNGLLINDSFKNIFLVLLKTLREKKIYKMYYEYIKQYFFKIKIKILGNIN